MNLRLAASLVVVATLAYACGPRTQTDATLSSAVAPQGFALASIAAAPMTRRTNTRERTLKKETAKLSTQFDIAQHDKSVRFAFHVINASGKRVEIKFPSGQAYDFIVVDSLGREVWRWANGRIFTQSVQNKLLEKGAELSIAEEWSPARSGKYTAIAELQSSNFPIRQRVEFERK